MSLWHVFPWFLAFLLHVSSPLCPFLFSAPIIEMHHNKLYSSSCVWTLNHYQCKSTREITLYRFKSYPNLIFCLESLHFLDEFLSELFDLVIVAHVLQSQLILILRLQLLHTRFQIGHHGILYKWQSIWSRIKSNSYSKVSYISKH